MIRSPHQQIASRKALTYSEKDDEGRDIFELYETEDKRHIDSLFESLRKLRIPKDGPGELLKARLAASITARRRQFRYWERHEKKLARNVGDAANRQSISDHALQDNKQLVEPLQAPTVLSATVASDRMAATALDESMETATVVTTASTARDLQGRTAEFPELQRRSLSDESDSQGDYSGEPTAEGNLQQRDSLTVSQALQISRESPHDALDPAVSNILEDEFAQICSEMQSQPDSYVMTHDEFAVFNHFQQRFQGNRVADDARSRYWAAQRSSQNEQDDPTAYGPADGDASGVVPSGAIAWGDWKRLADGQWHREGQDASGNWFENTQDEEPDAGVNSPSASKEEDFTQYLVQRSRDFSYGTVFKVMWSEPMGNSRLSKHNTDPVGTGTPISEYGKRDINGIILYEGIRRFIVVDGNENGARNGNSICV
ncbi:hypothetical protein E8E14_001778 [Neopestalotiopsis sp. 37M]|nr:hypothetical protein E8E14_001778 [Neopestalotiopsis sp. 37M]